MERALASSGLSVYGESACQLPLHLQYIPLHLLQERETTKTKKKTRELRGTSFDIIKTTQIPKWRPKWALVVRNMRVNLPLLVSSSSQKKTVNNKKLKDKIIKFRDDELDHKDIAYEEGATKKGLYSVMDKVIKTGSRIAINISEKI